MITIVYFKILQIYKNDTKLPHTHADASRILSVDSNMRIYSIKNIIIQN